MNTRVGTVAATQNLSTGMVGSRNPLKKAEKLPTGQHMSFVSTIKKLICGRTRARRSGWKKWAEVTGLCGFWDGSCDNGNCGAGILIKACSDLQGWIPVYKKCGPALGHNSLDAELGADGLFCVSGLTSTCANNVQTS